eukprot:6334058-Amphidinium_carterae.1
MGAEISMYHMTPYLIHTPPIAAKHTSSTVWVDGTASLLSLAKILTNSKFQLQPMCLTNGLYAPSPTESCYLLKGLLQGSFIIRKSGLQLILQETIIVLFETLLFLFLAEVQNYLGFRRLCESIEKEVC